MELVDATAMAIEVPEKQKELEVTTTTTGDPIVTAVVKDTNVVTETNIDEIGLNQVESEKVNISLENENIDIEIEKMTENIKTGDHEEEIEPVAKEEEEALAMGMDDAEKLVTIEKTSDIENRLVLNLEGREEGDQGQDQDQDQDQIKEEIKEDQSEIQKQLFENNIEPNINNSIEQNPNMTHNEVKTLLPPSDQDTMTQLHAPQKSI